MQPKKTYFQPRKTINSVPSRDLQIRSVSATRSNKPQKTHQQMQISKNICSVLQLCNQQNKRMSPALISNLKPSQKALTSTMTAFLRQFDNQFSQKDLQSIVISQVFNLMGYPTVVSQNLFNPIGAPHTWNACLSLLQWLAQLTRYHIEQKIKPKQEQKQDEIQQFILEAYNTNNRMLGKQRIQTYLNNKKRQLQKQNEKILYITQNINLEMKNLNNTQKDLAIIKQQLSICEEKLRRERQLVTSNDQQLIKIQHQTLQIQQKTKQIEQQTYQLQVQIKRLENVIAKQQLSVSQVECINLQKKQFQLKKKNLAQSSMIYSQQYTNKTNQILQKYLDVQLLLDNYNKKLIYFKQLCNTKNTNGMIIQSNKLAIQNYFLDANKQDRQYLERIKGFNNQKIIQRVNKFINDTMKQIEQLSQKITRYQQQIRDWRKNIKNQQQSNKSCLIKKLSIQQSINVLKTQIITSEHQFNKFINQKEELQIQIRNIKQQTAKSEQKMNEHLNEFQTYLNFLNKYQNGWKKAWAQSLDEAKKYKQSLNNMLRNQQRGFKNLNKTVIEYFHKELSEFQ